ncbi:hypothetical protein D3C87_219430 [compost metagenome]
MGFLRKGNMAVERILANPVYAGLNYAKAFKEYPGGLFPALNERIIDFATRQAAQSKKIRVEKPRTSLYENLQLRGVLKCHCGNPISGTPSRGRHGGLFYYYKYKHSGHNNISAPKSHEQLLGAWRLMSVPQKIMKVMFDNTEALIEKELSETKKKIQIKKVELEKEQAKMISLEDKFIENEISRDTYERWNTTTSNNIRDINAAIEQYNIDPNKAWKILNKNIELITDMGYVYENIDILEKRDLVKIVFDSNLYYENGVYRTPTMLNVFAYNELEMKEENCLVYKKKG